MGLFCPKRRAPNTFYARTGEAGVNKKNGNINNFSLEPPTMAISSYSTPTGGLIQLKFVKIKFSLETPTMAISAYSTPTGCLNQLKFVQINKVFFRNSNHGYISLQHAYRMPKSIKIRTNKVFFRNSNDGYQLSQHAYRMPKAIKIRKNKVLFRNSNHG